VHISEPFIKSLSKFLFRKEDLSLLNNIKIESNRLLVVPISQDHDEIIFQEFTPEIRRYMVVKVAKTVEDTRSFILDSIQAQKEARDILFVALDKKNRELIGTVGLHAGKDGRSPGLGVWIKKDYHGKNVGTEAVEALCKWAEIHMEIEKYIFEVAKENMASRRIPEKLGGTIHRIGKIRTYEGGLMDEVVYNIPVPFHRS
jgi:[ribosomal protein S5]-alanine N-acetyltransferase